MADIDTNTRRGLMRDGTNTSPYNALNFAVGQQLQNDLNTAWIGRVDEVTGGDTEGSGTLSATQLIAQSDAEGNALPMAPVPALPWVRYQHGIAAVIIDPVVGDIVALTSCKQDITPVTAGTTEPQRAGSYRKFDQSDSVAIGSIHTQAPEVYIHIKQDKTIAVIAPEGYTVETDANVKITASGSVTITAPTVTINGNLVVNGEATANGVALSTHTHGGVDRGDSDTNPPN